MIDTHCHPLPYIDDGAADWDTALEMARMAYEDGVRQCIATPHWTGAEGAAETVKTRLEELTARLKEAGIDLRVHLGNEVVLVPKLAEALRDGTAFTLAGSNYVLLETAQLERGAFIHDALFRLQGSGYRVILAHPERVGAWQDSTADLRELLLRGCFLQVNQGSLAGSFGPGPKKTAEHLLRLGWVSLLASDGHSTGKRPPLLSTALRRCEELIGPERARMLVEDNPARILCNEQLPWIEADAPPAKRSFFSWLPWKR